MELYNFVAWVAEYSSEATIEKKVEIQDEMKSKVLTLAQDLIYISSAGRTQNHKAVSLGMAVKQITGSAKLISMLNGFGHCVSSSTVMNHETALAILSSNKMTGLPTGVLPRRFATFDYDNADFNEETLRGKGRTHIANGICIQMAIQVEHLNTEKPTASKNIRQIDASFAPLEDFYLGKTGVVIEFSYILCKSLVIEDSDILPRRIAFNTKTG